MISKEVRNELQMLLIKVAISNSYSNNLGHSVSVVGFSRNYHYFPSLIFFKGKLFSSVIGGLHSTSVVWRRG